MHEIAATRAARRAAAFDELIERIKSSGGVISKDETSPLYVEVGMQEFEVGSQRTVEFTLNLYPRSNHFFFRAGRILDFANTADVHAEGRIEFQGLSARSRFQIAKHNSVNLFTTCRY